ncbi:MAG: biopolymer transporter ExbD [Nitrospirae bacterium]|nr:biopolymer transporter ExbD [Nitrospirota bacterium]
MDRELNQINVIPLVDVMLVLLVIVLTTATFITAGQIPVNLAKVATAGDRQDAPLIMTVTAEGELFVNDRSVTDEQLDATLFTHPRESLVLVRADKATRLERFVTLVDRVRGLGFRQVSLEVIRM